MRLHRYVSTVVLVVLGGASASQAGPALLVTKPPVVGGSTGPAVDPLALAGQWFQDVRNQSQTALSHEFYDNKTGFGGGSASTDAIKGVIKSFDVDGQGLVTGFVIEASITNDTCDTLGPWESGSNSHDETLKTTHQYQGDMLDVRLSASFADDGILGNFNPTAPGNTGPEGNIYAKGYEDLAWFSFTTSGAYQVPTWRFGNIDCFATVVRDLSFGLYRPTDNADLLSRLMQEKTDLFVNRTTSLKISDYFDTLSIDDGTPYPTGSGRGSDVSVFFVPEPSSVVLAAVGAVGMIGLARTRRKSSRA